MQAQREHQNSLFGFIPGQKKKEISRRPTTDQPLTHLCYLFLNFSETIILQQGKIESVQKIK